MIKRQALFVLLVSAVAGCGNSPIAIQDLAGKFVDNDCTVFVECGLEPDSDSCHAALGNETDSASETLIVDVNAGIVK
jgi:hypothetical protein